MSGLAWVLGNGPTLPVADLHWLRREFTVGTNRILETGFCPSAIVFLDDLRAAGLAEAEAAILASPAVSVTLATRRAPADLKLPRRPPKALDRQQVPIGHEDPRALYAWSTGAAAVRWCFALGFHRVSLLGFGGAGHFHGGDTPQASLDLFAADLQLLRDRYGHRIEHADDPQAWDLRGGWTSEASRAHIMSRCGAHLVR